MLLRLLIFTLTALAGAGAQVAKPHAHGEETVVQIGTLHGQMKYDVERFQVEPGARVKLVFKNTDEMQHNVVITSPGENVALEVSQKAWALGAEAVKKQFVPDDERVLFHTRVVDPQAQDTLSFIAPKQAGDYPYVCTLPGHAYLMKGIMRVGSPSVGLSDLQYAYYEGTWKKLPDFSQLKPKSTGALPAGLIDTSVAERGSHFAIVFTGILNIPEDGNHTFQLNSDDGSRLLIDGEQVVEFDGIHGAAGDRTGSRMLKKGQHPLRVEYFEFEGNKALHVAYSSPAKERVRLSVQAQAPADDHRFHLHVGNEPLVVRTFVAGGPARAISVGLPGGISYCFNADLAAVEFGWIGGFLDVGPDRGRHEGDRGGGWSKVLGERFAVGMAGFPLRFGDPEKIPAVRFNGYRRTGTPEFLMTADGVEVSQTVHPAPAGVGLQYEFVLDGVKQDVYFVSGPTEMKLTSSAGEWSGATLRVPAAEAKKFTVTLTKP